MSDSPEALEQEAAAPVPAGFWVRAGAYMADMLLFIGAGMLAARMAGVMAMPGIKPFLAVSCAVALAAVAYETLMVGAAGRTLGKMAAGLLVLSKDGERLDYGGAFKRCLSRYACILSANLGYIMAAFTPGKRGLHDYIAGTRVVYAGEVSILRKALVIALPPLAYVFIGVGPALQERLQGSQAQVLPPLSAPAP